MKSVSDFRKNGARKDGFDNYCKPCRTAYLRDTRRGVKREKPEVVADWSFYGSELTEKAIHILCKMVSSRYDKEAYDVDDIKQRGYVWLASHPKSIAKHDKANYLAKDIYGGIRPGLIADGKRVASEVSYESLLEDVDK